jgi:hypothetical protein
MLAAALLRSESECSLTNFCRIGTKLDAGRLQIKFVGLADEWTALIKMPCPQATTATSRDLSLRSQQKTPLKAIAKLAVECAVANVVQLQKRR